jgi:hypothetical protein
MPSNAELARWRTLAEHFGDKASEVAGMLEAVDVSDPGLTEDHQANIQRFLDMAGENAWSSSSRRQSDKRRWQSMNEDHGRELSPSHAPPSAAARRAAEARRRQEQARRIAAAGHERLRFRG